MKKGEPGSTMRSRLAGSRGPHRFLLLAVTLVLVVMALNYWRLVTTNSDLTERLHKLEELLQQANTKWVALDGERQKGNSDLLKANAELHRLQVELEDRVLKLQDKADLLTDMEDDRTNCQKEAEELREKHEQELSEQASDRQARLTQAQHQLAAVERELEAARRNLTQCSSQSCGDRVTQLQFDLDTCRFSQKHAGIPGIMRPTGGDPRGPGQLPLLSPAAVRLYQPALRGVLHHNATILPSDPANSYRPPPLLSVAAAAGGKAAALNTLDRLFESGDTTGFQRPANAPASSQGEAVSGQLNPPPAVADASPDTKPALAPADGGDDAVNPVNPATAPAPGEVVGDASAPEVAPVEGDMSAPAAAQGDTVPEVAPVEGEVAPVETHEEAGGKAEEVAEEAAEEPAAEEAAEEAPVEDGAGMLSRPSPGEQKPARHALPRPAREGAAAGEPPLDLEYPNSLIKDDLEKPDGAGDEETAQNGDTPAETPQRDGAAVKEAALISGLQELSEKAAQGADRPDGDTLAEAKPAESAAADQKLADFEDLSAV